MHPERRIPDYRNGWPLRPNFHVSLDATVATATAALALTMASVEPKAIPRGRLKSRNTKPMIAIMLLKTMAAGRLRVVAKNSVTKTQTIVSVRAVSHEFQGDGYVKT